MSDPTNAFTQMVPGFDFLQNLVKNAGAAMPAVGQWVAPTLDPEELEKRINDLRTVQFWLEQNARLLGATIQALEVQRMTLTTLKTMNVSLGDLTESLKIRMPTTTPATPATPPTPAATPAPAPAEALFRSFFSSPAAADPPAAPEAEAPAAPAAAPAAGVIDPMQWWGALTQQFTELASNAIKDGATDAARNLAGAMVKQGLDAAGESFKSAAAQQRASAEKPAAADASKPPAAKKAPARKRSPGKTG